MTNNISSFSFSLPVNNKLTTCLFSIHQVSVLVHVIVVVVVVRGEQIEDEIVDEPGDWREY
jgi:hypothetical protein